MSILSGTAQTLTAISLSMWKGCSYESIDQDRGRLTISKDVLYRLELFTRRPGSEGCIEELGPFFKYRPLPVVFNGSIADQHKESHFLPPCGFWARFLLSELENQNNISKVFAFNVSKDVGIDPGTYVIPLFEVKIEGYRVELYLAAVPIQVPNMIIPECDFLTLPRLLGDSSTDTVGTIRQNMFDDPGAFIDLGREFLELKMEEKMASLRAENRYRIEARINSLKKGSEVRIERLEKKVSEHSERAKADGRDPSQDFIRLTEAQINVEERRRDEKIEKLLARRELSLTMSLVGSLLCMIRNGSGDELSGK